MFRFSKHNILLLALGLIVWDRSEILFLKHFSDVQQVAFYSLAFSIVNQLLMAPRALSSAVGITILAQYGRDSQRLHSLLRNATRYVSVVAIPLFLGTAAMAGPLIQATYGERYLAVVPVLWIVCIFSIPRAFQVHTENLLQATEKQKFMVKWLAITAAVNVSLDALLIPRYGALGAGVANGLAQTLGIGGLFWKANGIDAIRSQARFLAALTVSGIVMVSAVALVIRPLAPWPGLVVGIIVGAVVFFVSLRITRSLETEDWDRLCQWTMLLPKPLHKLVLRMLVREPAAEPGARYAVAASNSSD